jgi:hypothetical protein
LCPRLWFVGLGIVPGYTGLQRFVMREERSF